MIERRTLILFVLAAIATCVPIFVVEIVPSGDGPQHLLAAYAVAHADQFTTWVTPQLSSGGHVFSELLAYVLLRVFSWRTAYAGAHALLVILWLASVTSLGAALGRPRQGIVVGAATAYSWVFYIGLSSFHVGAALTLFATALVVSGRDRRAPGSIGLALLLLVATRAHPLAGVIGGLLVVTAAVVDPPGRWKRVARVIVCGIPAAALALWTAGTARGLDASATIYDGAFDRFTVVAWGYLGGPAWRAWPPVILAVVGLAQAWRRGRAHIEFALASTCALLVLTAWILPRDGIGWQFVNMRPLLPALTIALLLIDTSVVKAPRAIVAAASAVIVLTQLWWSTSLHLRFARETAELRRHIDDPLPRPAGYRIPVVTVGGDGDLDSGLWFFNPLANLGHLFPLGQGGFVAFSFSSLPAHLITRQSNLPRDPERPALIGRLHLYDEPDRSFALTDLVDHARAFDGAIVFEDTRDHPAWLSRGYVPLVNDGRFMLLEYRGCRAAVTVPPELLGRVVAVESRFAPLSPGGSVMRHPVRDSGSPHIELERVGCGDARIVLHADDGQPTSCERITLDVSAAAPRVVKCGSEIAPPP